MTKTIDDFCNFFTTAPAAFATSRAKEDSDRAAARKAEDDDLIAKRKVEDDATEKAREQEDADILAKRQAIDAEYADFADGASAIKARLASLPPAA